MTEASAIVLQPRKRIAPDVRLGCAVSIGDFVSLCGCEIGDATRIGPFVEIQAGAVVGARCTISSHCLICAGVHIEDEVLIGSNVTFINQIYPRAMIEEGPARRDEEWLLLPTSIGRGACIGSSATILCGITVGERAIIGAGALLTRNVPPDAIFAGNPAAFMRRRPSRDKPKA